MGRGSVQLATGRRARPRIARCERVCGSSRPSSGPRRCGARVGARRRCTSCSSVSGFRVGQLERDWRLADLEPFEAARAEEMRRPAWSPASRGSREKLMRLEEWAELWFDDLPQQAALAKAGCRERTYNCTKGHWANHLAPAFGAMPLAAIDAAAIRRYVNTKLGGAALRGLPEAGACERCKGTGWLSPPLAPVDVNGALTPLSAMLTDAVDAGHITANPARQPRRSPAPREPSCCARVRRRAPGRRRSSSSPTRRSRCLGRHAGRAPGRWCSPRSRPARAAASCSRCGGSGSTSPSGACRSTGSCRAAQLERLQVPLRARGPALQRPRRRSSARAGRPRGSCSSRPTAGRGRTRGPEREFLRAAYEAAGLRGARAHVARPAAHVRERARRRRDPPRRRRGVMGHKRQGTTSPLPAPLPRRVRRRRGGTRRGVRRGRRRQRDVNGARCPTSPNGGASRPLDAEISQHAAG